MSEEVVVEQADSIVDAAAEETSTMSKKGSKPRNHEASTSLLDLEELPASNQQLMETPFGEAIKAQQEVDPKTGGLHWHYIPRQKQGEITREHEQYALTYCMMLGIKHSVTTWQTDGAGEGAERQSRHRTLGDVALKDMKQGVTDSHFATSYKVYFPPEGHKGDDPLTTTPPHLLKQGFKFKDYAPEVFRRLRRRFEIDDLDYLHSLSESFNFIEFISNSRSGEFFFYSHDGRFLIKTLRRSESRFMRKILPRYYEYVADNPNSMLVRICGAHRVKVPHLRRRMHFVIMMSVFADATEQRPVNRIYDLKGATLGRTAKPGETVKKDQDILNDKQNLHLGPKRAMFLDQIAKDSLFLSKLGIMDYSLLVGIHERAQQQNSSRTIVSGKSGSFVFRSDRRTSQQQRTSTRSMDPGSESPKAGGATPQMGPRKTSSLPQTFSQNQILMGPGAGGAAEESRHNSLAPIEDANQADLERLAREADAGGGQFFPASPPRPQPSNDSWNTFYKIDAKDSKGNPVGETYHVGIIDIFTQYSAKKSAEHLYKSAVTLSNKASAVPPKEYQHRFVEFLRKICVDN